MGVGSGGGALAGGLLPAAGGVTAAVAGRNWTKLSGNIPLFPFLTPSHQPSSTLRGGENKENAGSNTHTHTHTRSAEGEASHVSLWFRVFTQALGHALISYQ